jgi:hypothetical protein
VKNRFQSLPFKRNLQRYSAAEQPAREPGEAGGVERAREPVGLRTLESS